MSIEDVFTHFPQLETERLILRQIHAGDVDALFTILSDPKVMEFGDKLHHSREESEAFFQKLQEWYKQRENVGWGITYRGNDTLIGTCGFYAFDAGFHRADTGYELRPDYWRQGIMSEALRAIIPFAFTTMGLHRIDAVVHEGNERSQGILRKLGFVHEGTLRQRFFLHDRFLDEYRFGLLKDEWQK
jgi:[ribosomal protein S5]-alanine N-acetyltransferase